ncbi:MAG: AtpZ/AtpI family protein [Oscillospiraceae bacterium]
MAQTPNGKKNNYITSIIQGISFLGQLGLSIATPVVMCLVLAYLAQKHLNAGEWVWLVALVLGLGGGASSFITFAKRAARRAKRKNEDNTRTSFNK